MKKNNKNKNEDFKVFSIDDLDDLGTNSENISTDFGDGYISGPIQETYLDDFLTLENTPVVSKDASNVIIKDSSKKPERDLVENTVASFDDGFRRDFTKKGNRNIPKNTTTKKEESKKTADDFIDLVGAGSKKVDEQEKTVDDFIDFVGLNSSKKPAAKKDSDDFIDFAGNKSSKKSAEKKVSDDFIDFVGNISSKNTKKSTSRDPRPDSDVIELTTDDLEDEDISKKPRRNRRDLEDTPEDQPRKRRRPRPEENPETEEEEKITNEQPKKRRRPRPEENLEAKEDEEVSKKPRREHRDLEDTSEDQPRKRHRPRPEEEAVTEELEEIPAIPRRKKRPHPVKKDEVPSAAKSKRQTNKEIEEFDEFSIDDLGPDDFFEEPKRAKQAREKRNNDLLNKEDDRFFIPSERQQAKNVNNIFEEKKKEKKKKKSGFIFSYGANSRYRKRTIKDITAMIVVILAGCLFIVAGIKLFTIFGGYKEANDKYDDISKKVVVKEKESDDSTEKEIITWDFTELFASSPDVRGYIYQEDIVNYPIVQGSDNSYYLTHMIDGTPNDAGTLFIDCYTTEGIDARNCIVYGHNMKDGSMFGRLYDLEQADYYQTHKEFHVFDQTHHYVYKVLSAYTTPVNGIVYQTNFGSDEEFVNWMYEVAGNCPYETEYPELNGNSHVMTLSTCIGSDYDYRFVVVLIRDHEAPDFTTGGDS